MNLTKECDECGGSLRVYAGPSAWVCFDCLVNDLDQLKAENARLIAALQAIADKGPASPGDKKAEMAKEALGGKVADIGRTE